MSLVVDRVVRLTAPATPGRRSRSSAGLVRYVRARVYVPAFLIVALAAVLVAVGWAGHWGGQSFIGSMTSIRVVVVGPAALATIGVLLIAERLWPAQKRPILARGYRQDLMYTIFNATLTVPFIAAITLSFSVLVREHLPWLTFPRMNLLPHALVIAAIFVAMDGCNWFGHFANHRVRALWRFHELHHSQEDMNVLTVFRTHPFVHVVYLISLLPGIVLLANGALPSVLLVVYAGEVAVAHSNIRLSFGPLGRIFVSPNYHRIHHRAEGRQDVNLGFALTIWDQLFGAAIFPTKETVGIVTGLAGRPLVVEFTGERPRHFSVFAAQMVAPFRPVGQRKSSSEQDPASQIGPVTQGEPAREAVSGSSTELSGARR